MLRAFKPRLVQVFGSLFLMFAAVAMAGTASAAKFKTIHSFCGKTLCIDGSTPQAGLVEDQDGNLYGTTYYGGTGSSSGVGTVYRLTPKPKGGWAFSVIYSFCSQPQCADGMFSKSPLIVDVNGNLYGLVGGSANGGLVFMLKHNADRSQWTFSRLYTFCLPAHQPSCDDGQDPTYGRLAYAGQHSGAYYDGVSPLYGMTNGGGGGSSGGVGVVYSLAPKKGKPDTLPWIQTVLHTFCSSNTCRDDTDRDVFYPFGGLAVDDAGNLFGLASWSGGSTGGGGIFEMHKKRGVWSYSVLSYLTDKGYQPNNSPLIDAVGNIFFTTQKGGQHNGGTIFQLVPNGKKWRVTPLYSFCVNIANCNDGLEILSGVVADSAGNLFGTAHYGGTMHSGTVYELPKFATTVTTLHSFCSETNCTDGSYPMFGDLFVSRSGHVFGVTGTGGAHDVGTIFEIVP
jgi:uncharacterized repeat protein (TIGR03803 family)